LRGLGAKNGGGGGQQNTWVRKTEGCKLRRRGQTKNKEQLPFMRKQKGKPKAANTVNRPEKSEAKTVGNAQNTKNRKTNHPLRQKEALYCRGGGKTQEGEKKGTFTWVIGSKTL